MNFQNDQLQLVLNYDTCINNVLTFEERCEIHRAISHKLNRSYPVEFGKNTGNKIQYLVQSLKEIQYKHVQEMYYEDKTGSKKLKQIDNN